MKNMKLAIAFGFFLITLFGAYYYQDILSGKYTNNNVQQSTKDSDSSLKDLIERKYSVQGMFCESCKSKIEKQVSKIGGVSSVFVDQSTNEMIVKYKPGNDHVKQTMDVVKGMGYKIGLKSKTGRLQVTDFNVTFVEIIRM